jgi:hypothetical protein
MLNSIIKKIFYILFTLNYKLKNEQIEHFLITFYGNLYQQDKNVVIINRPDLKVIKIFDKKIIIRFNEDSKKPFEVEADEFTLCYDGKSLFKKEKETIVYLDLNHFRIYNKIQIVLVLSDEEKKIKTLK